MKISNAGTTLATLLVTTLCAPSLTAPSLWGSLCGVSAADFSFNNGDHICLIGNLLAERMQHDGWLEAMLQSQLPNHELTVRNLGFSGDELDERIRSKDFGTPDQWLTGCQADVILAFFGYNESFEDEQGLPKFQQDLQQFIKHTLDQKYNGTSAPRLVLVSPIGFEDLGDPNLPDGVAHNRRLRLYTEEMARVAAANGVTFVDLLNPTLRKYDETAEPLTINGHYLNERGNRFVATVLQKSLCPTPSRTVDEAALDRIRQAVRDKNFYWFHRYRTTDGYNVYGGRAHKVYTDDVSNLEVMQREMDILDMMTANRDRRVWAVANGSDLIVNDRNIPTPIPVKTNIPGPLPGGKHAFLAGEAAIQKMTVAKGMQVSLFASDETFDELVNPVQVAFDTRGRLWAAVWPSYPHWEPTEPMNDKLLILEDTDGDGRADQVKTFADGLNNPTGFEFWNGGVLVAMVPDLLFLKDTDGDDVADVRQRILHGIDSADTHHSANSFVIGVDGALYFQEGTFHQSQIESVGGVVRNNNGCVWRFDPRTWRVDRYVPYNFANPHGHVFDRWGQDFVHDGTGAVPYHAALFSGHLEYPQKHPRPPVLYERRTRPCPATEILSSRHFPQRNQGNLLVANVIGFQGILQYKVQENGASFVGTEIEPIIYSSDPNFRPTDIEIGPEGAIYFLDWHNPIIGHLQHHIRDPNRDKTHGRIYRITYPSRPLLEPPQIAGAATAQLLQLLKQPDDRVRYRARIELSAADSSEVIESLERWVDNVSKSSAGSDPAGAVEHQLLEALWLYQQHNVVNQPLLERLLASQDHRVRAAAARVLCYWHDRIPGSLEQFRQLAADSHPAVRLQAVRAASFYKVAEAVEVPLISAEHRSDQYLDYTRNETMTALEPYWKEALEQGRKIAVKSDAGMRFLLQRVSDSELLKMPRDRAVYLEMLLRNGLSDQNRQQALAGLAKLEDSAETSVLLGAIKNLDDKQANESVVFDLVRLLTSRSTGELSSVRAQLEQMAIDAQLPTIRQIGFVALIAADDSVDQAWQLASTSPGRLRDLVSAMPLIVDPSVRASLYPKVAPLLNGLPAELSETTSKKSELGTIGRYVRIEIPGRNKTLTLAEVEVYSDGQNVARQGRAYQRNTASNGDASRALDGNKSGSYGSGGQTHTKSTRDPWWEVDLAADYPIDSISIFNRTDGSLGKRLDGFSLRVFDSSRQATFTKEGNPAPDPRADFEIGGGGPDAIIRRAAMNALTYVRGKEPETFSAIAALVRDGIDRTAGIRALQRMPRRTWPQAEAQPLVDNLLSYIRKIPTQQRTSPQALDALQLGNALASLLPAADARSVRAELGELGVRIIRIGTLPHRMAYDRERIVVQAGKPVQIFFENTDLMPHNLVIAQPGSMVELGLLAESLATDPAHQRRQYVPKSNKVLLSSSLLQPRQSEKLSFSAPSKPGVYPYVCTYPGHWRRMHGALYVVADLEEYLAGPEAYLASNALPIKDKLLKFNRPRTEWEFADFESAIEHLGQDRSFGNGKQMFEVATCVACHKLNGLGNEFGPDLTKLDPKPTTQDMLKHMLDPSAKIDDKYRTYVFELESGMIVTGMIVEETPDAVKIIENPLAKSDLVVLEPDEVAQRLKSPNSLMPKGLLDKLTRDEVLDLLAYVIAGGQRQHAMFHAKGHSH